jgi:hypothetical protein
MARGLGGDPVVGFTRDKGSGRVRWLLQRVTRVLTRYTL